MMDSIIFDSNGAEYRVQELIGRGGFGNVFKLIKGDKLFAVKSLQPNLTNQADFKSFVNEANNAVKIRNENVIEYYFFNDGEKYPELPPYIIMEYANKGSLDKFIKNRTEQFTNSELLNILSQLINGMKSISTFLVHRDIKPENILLSDGIFKITDFGLSKIVSEYTRHTTFKGWETNAYIAPEAWSFDKNTVQMDIYSMGLVFYELAGLEFPFKVTKGDPEEWRNIHLFKIPKNISEINKNISPILSSLIMKMIEKDPDRRPKNWDEIEQQIKKEELPRSENHDFVNKVLNKRNEQEQMLTEERLKIEKREHEVLEFKNLIKFQAYKDIIEPIKIFIDEINLRSDDNQIEYHFSPNSFLNSIFNGTNNIKIELKPIIEEDFYRTESIRSSRGNHTRKVLRLPKINSQRVLAWGYFKAQNRRGFNIILLQKKDNNYGEWKLLFNNHNVGIKRKDTRPEPFPFEFSEIEEEINYLNAAHIYVSSIYDLNINKIKEFLVDYF